MTDRSEHEHILHPILDPVRGAALAAAVEVWQAGYVDPEGDQIERMIATARRFERYLAGEESD